MIRAVLDANTVASGFAGLRKPDSIPGLLIRLWRQGRYEMIVSEHLRNEIIRTFRQPYFRQRLSPLQISRVAALLRYQATQTPITDHVRGVATHPEDDLILATALSGRVTHLVTGDEKLQRLGAYKDITILSPRAFLELLTAQPG
ncbi:MAG: putative toxin-antitoxin system toxin component, PIN family [Chloroflexi bacterium]|nr:putative toxin-antitoxin system toxin component, PIN family [Chloroflexota bacterium]